MNNRQPVSWDPYPTGGTANPHLMIVGESGYGKTYAIQCLLVEIVSAGKSAVIFDYGQGFDGRSVNPAFMRSARPHEILASTRGINVNPLRISTADVNGPVNVAVRVADTFARIYNIGIQQHALLREVILETYSEAGIFPDRPKTWRLQPPTLANVYASITADSENKEHTSQRTAQTLRLHLSSFFVFNTFRRSGEDLSWESVIKGVPQCYILQLHGLEDKTEKAVAEFLLWDLYAYLRSSGPRDLSLFCVLDEAHKLSFDANSPVDKLLREARKFGVGLVLASQQPEDFSSVAHSNTATKLIFHTSDRKATLAKLVNQGSGNSWSRDEVSRLLSSLERGQALYLNGKRADVLEITSFEDRPLLRHRLAKQSWRRR
jgi:DNA phosphorothioation-dependent restriction protein DptH